MKNYEEKKYRIESQIELAFPYLDKLDNKINILKDLNFFARLKEEHHYSSISKNSKDLKKYILKSRNHRKDGYRFQVKIEGIYHYSKENPPFYFLVYAEINYQREKRNNQFYKEFKKKNEAFNYYNSLNNEIASLKRRDIMEKIFIEKQKKINKLFWSIPFSFLELITFSSNEKEESNKKRHVIK